MDIPRDVARPLLVLGAAAMLTAVPVGFVTGVAGVKELPWLSLGAVFLVASVIVRHRRPDDASANWFAVAGGLFGLIQGLDAVLAVLARDALRPTALAWASLGYHLGGVAAVISMAHLLGTFPDGRASAREGRTLRVLPVLYVFPPLALAASPVVVLPYYHGDTRPIPNVLHLPAVAVLEPLAIIGLRLIPTGLLAGVALLVLRYRAGSREVRRRIRWLLLPALLAAFAAVLDLISLTALPNEVPRLVVDGVWLGSLVALPVAITIALLRPSLLDVDRVLQRSLVYGSLWTLIALTYVAAAAALGLAAGQRFDVGVAILLTVIATLVFQPARRRLEGTADRWVFGTRADPARLVARLGATLAETFDLDTLLPHIAETLRLGIGSRWVRVRLHAATGHAPAVVAGEPPDPGEPSALTVPIVLGSERLGQVECGPKANGTPVTEDDVELVTTLARQAALAVRNVKLTAELTDRLEQMREQAVELERSRNRLVRAQETERRRIERNIHDGVQQDLVALLSHTGRFRNRMARDPAGAELLLDQLQAGLRRVIADLRELAHGIHPTLLADRGLLEAVEALAARSSIPVTVRADPDLRGRRFPEEVEGASYFTIAEALTNVLKHAGADRAEVALSRSNGCLLIEVRDDGTGFDRAGGDGDGLSNLTERLAALGGQLEVHSSQEGTTIRAALDVSDAVPAGG
jgi:signal transduction histidine kinase